MDTGMITALMRQGIFQILVQIVPILGAALIIGLVVAIFQATTSIQEQTLTFLPKLLAILIMVGLLSGWMFTDLRDYTINLFNYIPELAR